MGLDGVNTLHHDVRVARGDNCLLCPGRKSHCVRLDKQNKYVVASRLVSAQSARKKRASCGDGAMAGMHLDDVNVWERALFMSGHKRVAVISDAAGWYVASWGRGYPLNTLVYNF